MKNENTIHAYRYGFLKIGLPYFEGENEPWLIFTHEDGESIKVRAYRSSDNECSVNFYPEKTGMYTYTTCENKVLGKIEVSVDENHIRHGIVKAYKTHFRYQDGTWFYPFGTTVYALVHQQNELVDTTMETLAAAPFNKVRMCLFPKHYDFNHNEPEFFAFEKDANGRFDFTKPCFAFWDQLERRIDQLDGMGIQCDLILFHPYDRWGFADMTLNEAKTYLDYAIRRLAAHPNIWWSIANEFDLMKYSFEEWEEIASFTAKMDPYGHLLSNHNCIGFWDFDNKDTTHVCLQIKGCEEVSGFIRKYRKPLMVDECCYEGNIAYEWGNISPFEMVNKFWMTIVQGGYCTHGETYLSDETIAAMTSGKKDVDDTLWWSKGGSLKGESPERIAFLKSIIDSLPEPLTYCGYEFSRERYDEINEDPSRAENDFWLAVASVPWERARGAMLTGKEYVACAGNDVFLKYTERKCAAITDFNLPDEYLYDVYLIDVWNMTKERILSKVGGSLKVKLPGKEGMALMAVKRENEQVKHH